MEMEYVSAKACIRWGVGVRGTLDADRGASFLGAVTSDRESESDFGYWLSMLPAPTVS